MADLGDVVGALLAGLAQARRIADEETVALAEHYRQQPLLGALSVPRVRVSGMEVDIPVVVEEAEPGSGGGDPDRFTDRVLDAVREWSDQVAFSPSPTLLPSIRDELEQLLRPAEPPVATPADTPPERPAGRPGVSFRVPGREAPKETGRTVVDTLSRISRRRFSDRELGDLDRRVRKVVEEEASRPRAPRMAINPLTRVVKETTDPSTVARLRISLMEEGLEWTTIESEDGTQRRLLTPE